MKIKIKSEAVFAFFSITITSFFIRLGLRAQLSSSHHHRADRSRCICDTRANYFPFAARVETNRAHHSTNSVLLPDQRRQFSRMYQSGFSDRTGGVSV